MTRAPWSDPPLPWIAASTAAAAVVFDPLASNRTETWKGPKKVFLTASRTASAAETFDPPMKIAVL